MTPPTGSPEATDALIDDVLRDVSPDAAASGQGLLGVIRDLHALSEAISPRAGFVAELEAKLRLGTLPPTLDALGDGAAEAQHGRWHQVFSRRRALLAPAMAATLAAIGVALWKSPAAQAQVARLASFVPGLGIRGYHVGRGIVAPQPVSLTRDGATMTVKSLLSTGDTTIVQVELTGLPASPSINSLMQPSSDQQIKLELRDAGGRTYPLAPRWGGMGMVSSGTTQSLRLERTFIGLDPSARAVDVLLDAPPPIGNWDVRVPVVPLQQSGLPAAQGQTGSVTLHSVTVSVANLAVDSQRTVIQLTSQAAPPVRFVRSLGRGSFPSQRVLRDDHGREYHEQPSTGRTFPDAGGHYTDDVAFPPLPADVRSAQLIIPFVIVEETGEASVQVPLAGNQVGERIPLNTTVSLGGYPLLIKDAQLVNQFGRRWLELHLDGGDWHDGRKLVVPGQVSPAGDGGMQFSSEGDVGQATLLRIQPTVDASTVTLTLKYPNVAVQGPWQLPVTVARPSVTSQ